MRNRLRRAARRVLAWERARRTSIEITLLDGDAMRRLNARHTGRRRVTDVIAFGLDHPGGALVGDVYICATAARRSARRYGEPLDRELVRLAVHGTLHLLGYTHPEGAGERRRRSTMWRKQERYVARLTWR